MGYSVSTVILAELYIIIEGTFFSLSWDIMEPISYMMGLFNSTVAFGWFYLFISNPSSQTIWSFYKERLIQKEQRRAGVEPGEIERL